MTYGIKELRTATGYTTDQLRDRLGLLQPILGHDAHRGPRRQILVGDAFRAALGRMAELEGGGLSPKDAQARIIEELGDGNGSGDHGGPASANVATLQGVIEDLRRDRDAWRTLAVSLQDRLLALPAPRRPWWAWWRR